ncbi:MAG: histidine ammonia-lyase [Planctomycetota bacterium]|jgi:histidine ammonia-lyase
MAQPLALDGTNLSLDAVRRLLAPDPPQLEIAAAARPRVEEAARFVRDLADGDEAVYGITTGFGRLAHVRIDPADVGVLQERLVVSHAAGVGERLPEPEARLAIAVRAATLASGYSGVRLETLEALLGLWNRGVTPLIPQQGSVCASGDLAPLAHIALTLLGKGNALHGGRHMEAAAALKRAGLHPVRLAPKEGLALINGTSVATAILARALVQAQDLVRLADIAAAMSLEALLGTDAPFDARVHDLRPHPGQVATARNMKQLLRGSRILPSHRHSDHKVQDPYSLRCVPQVHGAARDGLAFTKGVCERELNAVTDNPILFPAEGDVVSAGNFHGQHVALAADTASIALAELAAISERRIEQMVNPDLSNLPPFLAEEPGLNSGFMMAQTTAAALVSENKTLAHPASVDSIPTSANQEDHVSMGMWAARKCRVIQENVRRVLAIEFATAAQALDFVQLEPGKGVAAAHEVLRKKIPHLARDRYLARDIETAERMLADGAALNAVEAAVGQLQSF